MHNLNAEMVMKNEHMFQDVGGFRGMCHLMDVIVCVWEPLPHGGSLREQRGQNVSIQMWCAKSLTQRRALYIDQPESFNCSFCRLSREISRNIAEMRNEGDR